MRDPDANEGTLTGASAELLRFERSLAEALTSAMPMDAFRRLAQDDALDPRLRAAIPRADSDGVGLSALIIARLRFERLMHGSLAAVHWFEADPRAFTAAFKRYHAAVAPTAAFPLAEGRMFAAWLEGDERA